MTSLGYLELARTLAGEESPRSNAIFQALMRAHQDGRISALETLSVSIQNELKAVIEYRAIVQERLDDAATRLTN